MGSSIARRLEPKGCGSMDDRCLAERWRRIKLTVLGNVIQRCRGQQLAGGGDFWGARGAGRQGTVEVGSRFLA
nr:unnamed protein product [Digitaria exilis]